MPPVRPGTFIFPFALVTIMLVFQLLIMRSGFVGFRSGKTVYGLTNKRAIVMEQFRRGTVRSVPLDSLSEIAIEVEQSGKGSILCWSDASDWQYRDKNGRPINSPLFRDIADAEHVRTLNADAKSALNRRS